MIKILDSSGMKACDNYTINALGIPSRELMERAAEACVSMISDGRFDLGHVTAVCGTGNNGGDGMAIALMLARRGISVDVVFSGNKERCSPEAAFRLGELIESGIKISPQSDFSDSTLIIDALLRDRTVAKYRRRIRRDYRQHEPQRKKRFRRRHSVGNFGGHRSRDGMRGQSR